MHGAAIFYSSPGQTKQTLVSAEGLFICSKCFSSRNRLFTCLEEEHEEEEVNGTISYIIDLKFEIHIKARKTYFSTSA